MPELCKIVIVQDKKMHRLFEFVTLLKDYKLIKAYKLIIKRKFQMDQNKQIVVSTHTRSNNQEVKIASSRKKRYRNAAEISPLCTAGKMLGNRLPEGEALKTKDLCADSYIHPWTFVCWRNKGG